MSSTQSKKLMIRNSTAEFLIFTQQAGESGIEVRYEDGTIWLSQKLMAELFDVERSVITKHLKNIFEDNELSPDSVCANFAHTAQDGKSYSTQFYSLDAIISVGYRVNSKRATQFRQWATQILSDFAIKGYVLDNKRLENGSFIKNSLIFMQQALITTKMHRQLVNFLRRFKINCTMQFMVIPHQNSLKHELTAQNHIWD